MKATLIDRRNFVALSKDGRGIKVVMDLFKIHGREAKKHPQGFRLSWIAFDLERPDVRVLFDSHPPKGPHFHLDDEEEGAPFEWRSLTHAERLFFEMVARHFDIDPEDLP